ncbi:hypothetical protein BGX38DRAFT_1333980 [Terfezia claveryi]|nr:hypothetical protein BGX38DRAFT_1333980 [Terfezia claveryi]
MVSVLCMGERRPTEVTRALLALYNFNLARHAQDEGLIHTELLGRGPQEPQSLGRACTLALAQWQTIGGGWRPSSNVSKGYAASGISVCNGPGHHSGRRKPGLRAEVRAGLKQPGPSPAGNPVDWAASLLIRAIQSVQSVQSVQSAQSAQSDHPVQAKVLASLIIQARPRPRSIWSRPAR